jgi:shikimate dehydrogenase
MSSPALQDIIAVLGCPAAGNPAQYLYERACDAAGLDVRVLTADVSPERLAEALAGVAAMGFRGCVLAEPLASAALPLVASVSPAAAFAGAVNLVVRETGTFVGHFTPGRAVVEALRGHIDPAGTRPLVVGAGPVGRAVALELALAGAAGIVVCDRDAARAAALAEALQAAAAATRVEHLELDEAIDVPADCGILVAAGPDDAPPLFTGLRPDMVVADVTLAPTPTAVARQASGAGACLVDGLEIHGVGVAIEFRTLMGTEADPDVLRDALDEFLSA